MEAKTSPVFTRKSERVIDLPTTSVPGLAAKAGVLTIFENAHLITLKTSSVKRKITTNNFEIIKTKMNAVEYVLNAFGHS